MSKRMRKRNSGGIHTLVKLVASGLKITNKAEYVSRMQKIRDNKNFNDVVRMTAAKIVERNI